jgi:catechol 2,3-dioxygenase-like lactoylglutathione lyase family enzyme
MNRETFLKSAAAMAAMSVTSAVPTHAQETPLLKRYRVATLNTSELKPTVDWYVRWFDYKVAETGRLSANLAAAWNAPDMSGRAYTLLTSQGSPDTFLRIVEGSPAPAFDPRATFGWSSLEFIVQDLDELYRRFQAGSIRIFRQPASLGGAFANIHAMQIYGPMDLSHNLAIDKGDPTASNLPLAKSLVDRVFLIGINGPNLDALQSYYATTFRMRPFPKYTYPIPTLASALNLPADHLFSLTLVRGAEKGTTVEMHDLPPPGGPRPQFKGQLPPGVGLVSFAVANLDDLKLPYIRPPTAYPGLAYNGRRAATLKGPAGELIELIEE